MGTHVGTGLTQANARGALKPRPTEHDEQCALMVHVGYYLGRWPELALLYAIPNGGQRSKAVAGKLKAEGVKPGVPDLCLPVPRGGFHGLYIEMKRVGERDATSPAQKAWHAALRAQGYRVVVCEGEAEAMAVIIEYMRLEKAA